jgi:hypothetical protein
VSYPELPRNSVGHFTVRLHCHHCVTRFQFALVQVCDELIQRLSADAACEAVLEKEQRPIVGCRERAIEVVHS